jgi:hypothetical protein
MMGVFIWGMLMLLPTASAVRLAMEPQNRVIAGPALIDGHSGVTASVESRLTQLVYINMGGSISIPKHFGNVDSSSEQDWVQMNHLIWAAPGWRLPHRYRGDVNWDLITRAGFACVFTTDAFREDLFLIDPAGLVGLDAYLHYVPVGKQAMGVRVSNRLLAYQPDLTRTRVGLPVQRRQHALEVFLQW